MLLMKAYKEITELLIPKVYINAKDSETPMAAQIKRKLNRFLRNTEPRRVKN